MHCDNEKANEDNYASDNGWKSRHQTPENYFPTYEHE